MPPLVTANNTIKMVLNELVNKGHLKVDINRLIVNNSQLGKFRILCKLHKDKFGVRPIINNNNHPTSQLCELIDLLLQPIIQNTESYLRDSQNLMQKCKYLRFVDNKLFLYSMDFESLYTNMDKNDVAIRISEYINQFMDTNFIDSFAINKIILVIFENNVFKYKNNYFIQKNGLSMGSKCGPSLANLYVYILEKHWLHLNKPLFYGRFIDDICLMSNTMLKEEEFKQNFSNLKLNIISSKTINFLDLTITFDEVLRKLKFSLYIKPTNTFCYLKIDSCHPNFVFKNIPKALLIRVRRICEDDFDYFYHSRKLIVQLLSRGYCFNKLFALQLRIGRIQRDSLIPYKPKQSYMKNQNKTFFSGIIFNTQLNKKELLKNSLSSLTEKFNWLKDYNLKSYFTISPNILSILVHNVPILNLFKKYYTSKCNSNDCISCKFVNNNYFILLKEGTIVSMKDNCNCHSEGVVYIIKCSLCNVFYKIQTKRSCFERIKEHLRDIKNFIPYINVTSEVGFHFNLRKHDYKAHFSFFIFKKNIFDTITRLS